MNKYAQFYALIKDLPLDKVDIVWNFTEGRTERLSQLSAGEYAQLLQQLQQLQGPPVAAGHAPQLPQPDKADRLRKALISIFHQMDYKNAAAAARDWAQKMGTGTGGHNVKKPFNQYTPHELRKLIYKAQLALAAYRESLRRKMAE